MKLLETHFSHGALYNLESSLTSFDEALPQQDPYQPYRMEMSSPTMMVRSRNPTHTHKESLHQKYHYDDAYSDADSQDPHPPPPTQSRGKPSGRTKEKERKQKMVSQDRVISCVDMYAFLP